MDVNLSYTVGVADKPLLGASIGACLEEASTANGQRWAVVGSHQDARLTYSQLHQEVNRVARAFIAVGVERGDRVAIWSPSCVEWVIVQYATASIGAILVTINPGYREAELAHVITQSSPLVLVTARRSRNQDHLQILSSLRREVLAGDHPAPSRGILNVRTFVYLGAATDEHGFEWSDFVHRGRDITDQQLKSRETRVESDDPACILYTSGTTGLPKGATLSHHAVVNCGFFVGERLRYTPQDRICLPVPLYHVLGSVMGNLAAVTHGSCVVIPDEVFDVETCLATIHREACTALYGVPTMFLAILRHKRLTPAAVMTLRTGIIAGAQCPVALMRRIVSDLHMTEVTCCYGMTESPPITQTLPDDPIEKRVSTVGKVHSYVECKIVDPETGQLVPRETAGELCARGYGVMQGYWGDEDLTRATVDRYRWIHTGDMAVLHDDGHVSIVGRLKDMIIRGGENIYPREIEEVLHAHPMVAEAYVVGVPDWQYGEELCACIRLRDDAAPSEQDVRRHCRERLADYKIPRYVRFADRFPMTATGKVQRFKLRELMVVELRLYSTMGEQQSTR